MKHIFLAVALVLCRRCEAQRLEPPKANIVVRSAAILDLGKIASQTSQVWVVLSTTPDSPGNFVVEENSYIDHKKREIVITGPSSKPLVIGRFQILDTLNQSPPTTKGAYRWESATSSPYRTKATMGKDMLFVNFNTLVCQLNMAQKGRDQFEPVYPIPAQWRSFVRPGLQFSKNNSTLFDVQNVTANEPRLRQLLDDPNPFVAIAACRTLDEADKLDAAFVEGPMTRARGLRKAVFTLFFSRNVMQPKTFTRENDRYYRRAAFASQARHLANISDTSSLKSLVLGIYAGGVTTAYDPFGNAKRIPLPGFGPTLLRAISQRTRQLKITKPRSQDERDLLALLQNVGLR